MRPNWPVYGHSRDIDALEPDSVGKAPERQQASAQRDGVSRQDKLPPHNAYTELPRDDGEYSADSTHVRGQKHGAQTNHKRKQGVGFAAGRVECPRIWHIAFRELAALCR
jgi:hypothetical protein